MTDLRHLIEKHADLPLDKQVKAGKAIKGDMDDEHANFLSTLIGLLDRQEISSGDAKSFLKKDVYDKLTQSEKDAVDLSLANIADQIRLIENFHRSKETPDSSPQLQTMIEHLWHMKERIEEKHDVFKF